MSNDYFPNVYSKMVKWFIIYFANWQLGLTPTVNAKVLNKHLSWSFSTLNINWRCLLASITPNFSWIICKIDWAPIILNWVKILCTWTHSFQHYIKCKNSNDSASNKSFSNIENNWFSFRYLALNDLQTLGLNRNDSEPTMSISWATSMCDFYSV